MFGSYPRFLPRPLAVVSAHRWRHAGALACVAVGAVSALPAVVDLAAIAGIVGPQMAGPAHGTDFLNLYAGASLALHDPLHVYDLDAQLAAQRGLTGWQSPIVPFFLPPYALPLIAWLALLPYGVAYALWLLIGIGALLGAAVLLAPRWGGRWCPLVWLGVVALYLPVLLGLAQGQTSAAMLLAFAGFVWSWRNDQPWWMAVCLLVWLVKPQLALPLLALLLLTRRFDVLERVALLLIVVSALTLVILTPTGMARYAALAFGKFGESFQASPDFLPGATVLHAAHWLLGLNEPAHVVGIGLVVVAWMTFAGAADRLALVPILAVVAAPYALVHEMTAWLAAFWLLWPATHDRPAERAVLLWLAAGIWIAGNLGVIVPLNGGGAFAALLGLALLVARSWMGGSRGAGLPVMTRAERPLVPATHVRV